MKSLISALFATAALGSVGFADPAQAVTVLDFTGNICGAAGNHACGNNDEIGQNYGDSAAIDVQYRSARASDGSTQESFLKYWTTQYGDLNGVAWGGLNSNDYYSEISFLPSLGYEVTITGFDAGCYQNAASCQSFPFEITELFVFSQATNLSAPAFGSMSTSGSATPPNGGHQTLTFTLPYSSAGYVLRWGPDGYNAGLDNIRFDVRLVSTSVPEPATWGLMMLGFGAVGGAMRARRRRAALA